MSSTLRDPKLSQSFEPIDAPGPVGFKIKEAGYDTMWPYLAKEMPERVAEFGELRCKAKAEYVWQQLADLCVWNSQRRKRHGCIWLNWNRRHARR